jgi:hypothetical protein
MTTVTPKPCRADIPASTILLAYDLLLDSTKVHHVLVCSDASA